MEPKKKKKGKEQGMTSEAATTRTSLGGSLQPKTETRENNASRQPTLTATDESTPKERFTGKAQGMTSEAGATMTALGASLQAMMQTRENNARRLPNFTGTAESTPTGAAEQLALTATKIAAWPDTVNARAKAKSDRSTPPVDYREREPPSALPEQTPPTLVAEATTMMASSMLPKPPSPEDSQKRRTCGR